MVIAIAALLASASLSGTSLARAEAAHPGLASEALYSEALIAFSKEKHDDALKLLDRALQSEPDHIEALELKALLKKTRNEDAAAIELYERLLRLRPERESTPYLFELGVLRHRQKNAAQARAYFLKTIERKFNVGASHFFIGLIDLEAGEIDAAEKRFQTVSQDHEPELRMAGLYYLGLIQIRTGNAQKGADLLAEAREASALIKDAAAAPAARQAADRMIAPFDKGKFFANASVIPMYDNNVTLLPVIGFVPTGTQSIKALVAAGGGYITSPMRTHQFVYSLRADTNVNWARATLPYQFFTVNPKINCNLRPLSRTRWGAWIGVEHTLQYTMDEFGTFGYSFDRSYSTLISAGISHITPIGDDIQLKAHAMLRHDDYKVAGSYGSSFGQNPWEYPNGVAPRYNPQPWEYGGDLHQLQLTALMENGVQWLNPAAWITGDWFNGKSKFSTHGAIRLGVSNVARLDRRNALSASIEASGTRFYQTDRTDGALLLRLNHVFQFNRSWSVIADASYTINTSSWGEFSYNRYTGGVGVGWSL